MELTLGSRLTWFYTRRHLDPRKAPYIIAEHFQLSLFLIVMSLLIRFCKRLSVCLVLRYSGPLLVSSGVSSDVSVPWFLLANQYSSVWWISWEPFQQWQFLIFIISKCVSVIILTYMHVPYGGLNTLSWGIFQGVWPGDNHWKIWSVVDFYYQYVSVILHTYVYVLYGVLKSPL